MTEDVPKLSPSRTALLLLPILVILPYVVGTAVWNAPDSRTRKAAMPVVKSFMFPYLQQNWRLFAPNPPHGVMETWYNVRYKDGGTVRTTPARSVSEAYRSSGRSTIPPSVVERAVTDFEKESVRATVPASGVPRASLDRGSQPLDAAAARTWQIEKDVAQRVVSPLVDQLDLPGEVLAVRVYVTYRVTAAPGARHRAKQDATALQLVVNTNWMPFLAAGAR